MKTTMPDMPERDRDWAYRSVQTTVRILTAQAEHAARERAARLRREERTFIHGTRRCAITRKTISEL